MNYFSLDSISQIMFQGFFLGTSAASVKAWYLIPLVVVISLVYGGTRHESLSEIIAHSVRSVVWLVVFLFVIFALVWLSGFGTASDIMNPWDVQLLLAAMAWVFGAMWIIGGVFQTNAIAGFGCLLSGGILALVIGLGSCNLLPKWKHENNDEESSGGLASKDRPKPVEMWFPVFVMVAALGWALVAIWFRR